MYSSGLEEKSEGSQRKSSENLGVPSVTNDSPIGAGVDTNTAVSAESEAKEPTREIHGVRVF